MNEILIKLITVTHFLATLQSGTGICADSASTRWSGTAATVDANAEQHDLQRLFAVSRRQHEEAPKHVLL